jgi:uncharacterized protein YbcI
LTVVLQSVKVWNQRLLQPARQTAWRAFLLGRAKGMKRSLPGKARVKNRQGSRMQREIEKVVAEGISRFVQDYIGRRPKHIDTHLLGDILVARLHGVLTPVEQQLANGSLANKGRGLVKRMRAELLETTRPVLDVLVEYATGSKVVSLHHDISTETGEGIVVFTLSQAPLGRRAGQGAVRP